MSELGLRPIGESQSSLHQLKQHFINLVTNATRTHDRLHVRRFPGTMPLTLSRRHFGMIYDQDFVALEKSDGVRYMLFAVSSRVFLIDRNMAFFEVNPNPQILDSSFRNYQQNTLLDGELTYNIVMAQWQYLIYDCISINDDRSIAQKGFRERMLAAENFVVGPRIWSPACAGLLNIRIKEYYEKKDLRNLFAHIRKDSRGRYIYFNNDRRDGVLCNENDGIILCPVGIPYQTRKCNALLKWKPPRLNSIDFALQLEKHHDSRRNEPSVKCFLAYQGEKSLIRLRELIAPSHLRRKWAANFPRYNGAICEFAYDKAFGEWTFLRTRDDKETPNFASTVIDTMETVVESIEREELVTQLEKKSKPPPESQQRFIDDNAKNASSCIFRDDLFDEANPHYLAATPNSLIAPPFFPPHLRPRRRHNNDDDNHSSAVRKKRKVDAQSQEDRAPVSYEDDV